MRQAFIDDLTSQKQTERIQQLRRPLMVLHAPRDKTVGIDNAGQIYQATLHPKSFVAFDGADHLLSRPEDARFAADVIAAWAGRYLMADLVAKKPAATTSAERVDTAVPAGAFQVVERGSGAFAVDIRAGRHQWVSFEPASAGGDDRGPGRYDLLAAALGACTAMTLHMVALQKKWPLDHVAVELTHSKIHAQDCAECATRDLRSRG